MSTRRFLKLVRPHERQRLRCWLVWCLLIAAAVNVPFAVSRVIRINSGSPAGATQKTAGKLPTRWPTATPHAQPWPAPTSWSQWKGFGQWHFDVRSRGPSNSDNFSLVLRWSGWPLPVLEHKMMWWEWSNPALKDIDGEGSDPPMRLMLPGLIFNPIIVGSGAWMLMTLTFFLTVTRKRARRLRRGLCLNCGYDLAGLRANENDQSTICPECGSPADMTERAST